MMVSIDLHIHSTASDGTLKPAEIVDMAESRAIDVIALTDHDTVAGVPEALERAEGTSVRVIPGVEISADDEGVQAHVLGYFIDHTDGSLVGELRRFAEARLDRAYCILEKLHALGISLPSEQLGDEIQGGAVGRPHIARLLMQEGYVASIEEAFGRYLNHGQKAYVPRAKISPADAIEMIHGAQGLAVLAHPWSILFLVEPLVEQGLDGLEVFYRDYDACQHGRLARLAQEYGLFLTGGSDYHGPGRKAPSLGEVRVPVECLAAMDGRYGN